MDKKFNQVIFFALFMRIWKGIEKKLLTVRGKSSLWATFKFKAVWKLPMSLKSSLRKWWKKVFRKIFFENMY